MLLCADRKSFSGVQNSWDELRTTSGRWERLISAWMKWKQLRRAFLDDMWEAMGWDEKSWDDVRRAHMIWDEMKCGVWSVKSAVWSVRTVIAWRCIGPGSCAGHVLGQHLCNSFAQSAHARAWLAHGACKFYRWKRAYSKTLRQLPPRFVRAPLIYIYIYIHI